MNIFVPFRNPSRQCSSLHQCGIGLSDDELRASGVTWESQPAEQLVNSKTHAFRKAWEVARGYSKFPQKTHAARFVR